ncbi:MAG: glycosyltransferase [Deinococcales bacterium]
MRILFAGQTYAPSTNGPAVFTTNLAEALAACGHHAAVIVPSTDGRPHCETRAGVTLHALPAFVWRRTGVAVTAFPGGDIDRILERFRPDVVHIQDHYPTSRAVLRGGRRRHLPVVGTNHFIPGNIALQLPLPPPARGAAESVLWWTVSSVFRRLDAVTAPSETAAALLRRHLPRREVTAISCGVDVTRFSPRAAAERRELRRRFALPDADAVALYVGRLDRDKNLELLVRAMALTAQPELLVVAGKGLQEEALKRLARRLGVGSRVRFSGYVDDDTLPALYAACDLFAMPSVVELLSIATLEAMATGLPVAAARAGALPELVSDGVNGELFDPADAAAAASVLRSLADRRASWPRFASAARERAEGHRLERTRERFEALYRQVAASRPSMLRAGGG